VTGLRVTWIDPESDSTLLYDQSTTAQYCFVVDPNSLDRVVSQQLYWAASRGHA
jgi:hypothetical protein